MGEWQRNELAGETDIVYVIAMHENLENQVPTADNFDRWQSELNFEADARLLDPARSIIDQYIDANPGPLYTQAVTVILDRQPPQLTTGAGVESAVAARQLDTNIWLVSLSGRAFDPAGLFPS